MRTTIEIRGARENNLKNVDVEIPRDKLIVVTGVSGSGKSSLAFDTVYAEGQRRLLASMSTFAKRFVGQLKKPDVDFVNGLSPVVSIDQKTVGSNPRSTVGTMTDISDYLRMLFATVGTPHCPMCDEALVVRTPHQMMEHILSLPKGTEVEVIAHFDNSTNNKFNPDPTKDVRWGDQTWEEMMIGFFSTISDTPAPSTAQPQQ